MSTPNKWGWYKEFHKMMAIKIHTKCFDGTKTYKVGWGKCSGWYLLHSSCNIDICLWIYKSYLDFYNTVFTICLAYNNKQ